MPFTGSHPAAILPFLRTPLPASALVVGSMAPDLTYFLPIDTFRDLTHEWLGVVTIDLGIGLVAWLIWRLARGSVVGLSPRWLRTRVGSADPVPWRAGTRWWESLLLLLAAITVGNVTHLLLDAPTHPGWLADHVAFLRISWGGALMTSWLHRLSSVVLAVIIVIWARRWVLRTPPSDDPAPRVETLRRGAWLVVVAVFVLSGLGAWAIAHLVFGKDWFSSGVIFDVARVSIGCLLGATALACVVFAVSARSRPRIASEP